MTVDDDPTPDARAEDDAEYDVRADARTVGGLGDGEAVRVVHEPDRAVESRLEIASQRPAVEPDGVGVLHKPRVGHERARDADAHGPDRAGGAVELPHQSRNSVEQRRVIPWRGHASSRDLVTRGRQRDRFDLGSADVDADAHGSSLRRAR